MKEVNYTEYRASNHGLACDICKIYWITDTEDDAEREIKQHVLSEHVDASNADVIKGKAAYDEKNELILFDSEGNPYNEDGDLLEPEGWMYEDE